MAWVTDPASQDPSAMRMCKHCTSTPGPLIGREGLQALTILLTCADPFLRSHMVKRSCPLMSGSPRFKAQVCMYSGKVLKFPKPMFLHLEKAPFALLRRQGCQRPHSSSPVSRQPLSSCFLRAKQLPSCEHEANPPCEQLPMGASDSICHREAQRNSL